jgi:DNA-binding SARP family transcriptional activator
LWTQLITAYYLAERQSDALDAYQRLKSTLADDLGIDPGPSVRALHGRILRQEPLNVRKAAQTTAVHKSSSIDLRTAVGTQTSVACLRAVEGGTATLEHGDRVRICDHEFVVEIGSPPAS